MERLIWADLEYHIREESDYWNPRPQERIYLSPGYGEILMANNLPSVKYGGDEMMVRRANKRYLKAVRKNGFGQ